MYMTQREMEIAIIKQIWKLQDPGAAWKPAEDSSPFS